MLKTPKSFQYDKITDTLAKENYRIASTDAIQFKVFANDGFKLVDMSNAGNNNNSGAVIEETVDKEGMLKLPLLGKVKVVGLTIREAQAMLEKEFEVFYVKPFVQMKVVNKRVIVFPGSAGAARVVPIANNNTTVFEALALAGGITEEGKAYRIKLIRRTENKPEVFLIDLSKIEGIAAGNITVLANDIIYVETRPKLAQKALQELTPYLSLLTSSLTLFYIFTK
ncbi:MAG: polysaccharide biosynthesis/export family protein [Bacteroidota bacterium]|nr:polysaccharide biosynthesis/export family protein [Bacteroidota bacterium]